MCRPTKDALVVYKGKQKRTISIVAKDYYSFSKLEFCCYCIICICGRVAVCLSLTVLLLIKRIIGVQGHKP